MESELDFEQELTQKYDLAQSTAIEMMQLIAAKKLEVDEQLFVVSTVLIYLTKSHGVQLESMQRFLSDLFKKTPIVANSSKLNQLN